MTAKSGGLGALLGGSTSTEADEGAPEEDYEAAKTTAASAVMSALKSNDREAFASALGDFVQLCME